MSFNNVVVSLGVFFKHTQNLIAQRSTDKLIFSEYSATHCLAIHVCFLCRTITFFLPSLWLVYTSAPTFLCVLLAEKIVFFSLSACTIVCCRGMLASPSAYGLWHALVGKLMNREYVCFYCLLIEGVVCLLCGFAQLFWVNPYMWYSLRKGTRLPILESKM